MQATHSDLKTSGLAVAIITNPRQAYGRNFIRGAIRYLEETNSSIRTDIISSETTLTPKLLRMYDGFIESVPMPELSQLVTHRPIITIDNPRRKDDPSCMQMDNYAIGSLAAEKLHVYGAVHFSYYDGIHTGSTLTILRSDIRFSGFCEKLLDLGVDHLDPDKLKQSRLSPDTCRKWINSLPKPAGIYCFNDLGALEIMSNCKRLNLLVPREVAVIGTDNDNLLCSLSTPPLSSIDPGSEQVAHSAMRTLIEQLSHSSATIKDVYSVPPAPRVIERESTGTNSVPNVSIQKALHLIASEAIKRKLTTAEVAEYTGTSLRGLELLFKQTLGKTIQQEILHKQLEQTKYLLRTTDLTIEQISKKLQTQLPSLRRSFIREEGRTPGKYRKRFHESSLSLSIPAFIRNPNTVEICFMSRFDGNAAFEYLRGVQAYAQNHHDIHLNIISHIPGSPEISITPKSIISDRHDGYIISPAINPPDEVVGNKPILYLEHQRDHPLAWSLQLDNYHLGSLAAEHLLSKGYTHFAFYSYGTDTPDSNKTDMRKAERYRGFQETLHCSERTRRVIYHSNTQDGKETVRWLKQLPQPLAIFTFNDTSALDLIHLCYQSGIRIPQDIALIGADNDELLCKLATPSLSSIHINFTKAGYQAVQVLADALHNRSPPPVAPLTYPPSYVQERQSTGGLASDAPELNAALHYICEHFPELINVQDIVAATQVSRRTLESRFRTLLNQSIHDYLQSYRLKHSEKLLSENMFTIAEVAEKSGFLHSRHFCQSFKKCYHQTPRQFRLQRCL